MILVLNCGSTSIKYKLFSPAAEEGFSLEAKGSVERLGSPEARLHHQDHEREINQDLQQLKDHTEDAIRGTPYFAIRGTPYLIILSVHV